MPHTKLHLTYSLMPSSDPDIKEALLVSAWIDWLVDEIVDAICTDSFLFSKLISGAGRSAGKPDKGVAVGPCRRNLWCACGTCL